VAVVAVTAGAAAVAAMAVAVVAVAAVMAAAAVAVQSNKRRTGRKIGGASIILANARNGQRRKTKTVMHAQQSVVRSEPAVVHGETTPRKITAKRVNET
jgi:hypothetical protein